MTYYNLNQPYKLLIEVYRYSGRGEDVLNSSHQFWANSISGYKGHGLTAFWL